MANFIKKGLVKLRTFFIECKRVFKVTRKPTREEFKAVSKVSAIGAGIIGLIGFLIQMLYQLFK